MEVRVEVGVEVGQSGGTSAAESAVQCGRALCYVVVVVLVSCRLFEVRSWAKRETVFEPLPQSTLLLCSAAVSGLPGPELKFAQLVLLRPLLPFRAAVSPFLSRSFHPSSPFLSFSHRHDAR